MPHLDTDGSRDSREGKRGGIVFLGQEVSFPQLVNMVMALVTLVGLYFGVIGQINQLEASQASTTSTVNATMNRLTTEFIALERRMDEEERTSVRLSALSDGTNVGVNRMQADLNQLEVYIRDQFDALRGE